MCAFLRGSRGFWWISGPGSRGGYRMCIRLKNNRWFFSYIWEVEIFLLSLGYQAQEGRMCRKLKGQKILVDLRITQVLRDQEANRFRRAAKGVQKGLRGRGSCYLVWVLQMFWLISGPASTVGQYKAGRTTGGLVQVGKFRYYVLSHCLWAIRHRGRP